MLALDEPREVNSIATARDVELDHLDVNNDPCPAVVVNVDSNGVGPGGSGSGNLKTLEYQQGDVEFSDSGSSAGRNSPAPHPTEQHLSDEYCYGVTRRFSEFNYVFFKGAVVFGPQVHQLIMSMLLTTFPVLFQSIGYGAYMPIGMHIATWVGYAATIASLIICAGTDPGVVPKRYHAVNCPVKQQVHLPDGRTVGIRYCYSCCVYRGPRTYHCGICGNCVDQFDHHCPWTGTCIGWRNYRPFLAFIHALNVIAAMLVVFAVIVTCDVSKKYRLSVLDAMQELHWAPAVILAFVFLAGNSVTGLLLVHWYLIVHNLTTAEHLKGTYAETSNVWDLGCHRNTVSKLTVTKDAFIESAKYQFKLIEVIRQIIAMQRMEGESNASSTTASER